MTSAGITKTATSFVIGIGLALGGVGLYTHLAPHASEDEQATATATTPAVPDSFQKLPDDDAPPPPAKPDPAPQLQPAPQANAAAQPTPPSKVAAAPQIKKVKSPAHSLKPHPETVHVAVRHAMPPVVRHVNRRPEPPLLLARNNTVSQSESAAPTPYQSAPYSTTEPNTPSSQVPSSQVPGSQVPSPQVQPVPEALPSAAPAQPELVPQPRQPRTVTIVPGTPLTIRINQTLSSDHNFAGDIFQGTLQSPIILDNALIAERGSKVTGKVVNVQRGGRGDGDSDLSVTLTQINTTDGQRIYVQTNIYDQQTLRNTGRDAAKVGGGAALGAIIGDIAGGGKGAAIGAGVGGAAGGGDVLLTHGRPAVLQSEAQIPFRLTAPVTITERINN